MACNYELEFDPNSKPPLKEDDPFTLRLKPELAPTCTFSIQVSGDFQETARQRSSASFKAKDNNPKGDISFTVQCENPECGPTMTNTVHFAGLVEVKDSTATGKKLMVLVVFGTSVVVGVLLGSSLGPAGSVTGGAIGAVVGTILVTAILIFS
ncbi:MAG: hypothetical protein U0R19_01710 [Bryobacteraceae bacterium]